MTNDDPGRTARIHPAWIGALLCFVLLAGLFAARPIRTPDVYFHVTCGNLIAQDGIPERNVFTDPGGDPWMDHEWGFQLLVGQVHGLFGWWGIIGLKILLVLGIFTCLGIAAVLARQKAKAPQRPAFFFGCLLLGLLVAEVRFLAAPELLSLFFLAALLLILEAGDRNWRWLWLAVPVVLLWANVHGFFLLGLLLALGGVGLSGIPEGSLGATFQTPGDRLPSRRMVGLLLGALVLAPLATPYGPGTLLFPFQLLWDVGGAKGEIFGQIQELASPLSGLGSGRTEVRLLLGLVLFWSLALLFDSTSRRLRNLLVGLLLFPLGFAAYRNIGFVAIGLIPGLYLHGSGLLDRLESGLGEPNGNRLSRVGTVLCLGLLILLPGRVWSGRYDDGLLNDVGRPGRALAPMNDLRTELKTILNEPPPGRPFNEFGIGHAWIYVGFPDEKPFICGNTELYDARHFARYRDLLAGRASFEAFRKEEAIGWVVLDWRRDLATDLFAQLVADANWTVAHVGPRLIQFVHGEGPEGNPVLKHLTAEPAELLAFEEETVPTPSLWRRTLALLQVAPLPRPKPLGRLHAANLLLALGKPDAALRELKRVRTIRPDWLPAEYLLGLTLRASGDASRAAAHLEKVVDRVPDNPNVLEACGLALMESGQPQRARPILERAVALAPDPFGPRENLFVCLRMLKAHEAIARLDEAHDPPSNPKRKALYHMNRAHYRAGLGEFRAAVRHLRRVEATAPDTPGLHKELGTVLFQLKELDAARKAFERALKRHPTDPELHYNLGVIHYRKKEWADCILRWNKVLKYDPDHKEVRARLPALQRKFLSGDEMPR